MSEEKIVVVKPEKTDSLSLSKTLSLFSIVIIILGGGVGWGILQTRVDNIVRENEKLRVEVDMIKNDVVRRSEFRDVINEIKEDSRTIRDDIKKILERLSRSR